MIVLDASALIDVVTDQPSAPWVLEQVVADEATTPAHQPAEVLSALARLVRAGDLDADQAAQALAEALALPQDIVPLTARLTDRAFALRDRIRVVDGLYVALAEQEECAIVTTDRRLAAASPPCEVRIPPP